MMKYLKRKKAISKEPLMDANMHRIQRGETILQKPQFKESLLKIKACLSVTEERFNDYYYPLLINLAHYYQQLPVRHIKNIPHGLLAHRLECTVNALKLRRGYLLPLGAVTEIHYQEQDYWTYAVFSACMLNDILKPLQCFKIDIIDQKNEGVTLWNPLISCYLPENTWVQMHPLPKIEFCKRNPFVQALLIKELMPEKGFCMLQQYPHIFEAWIFFLKNNFLETEDKPLANIIHEAEIHVLSVYTEAEQNEAIKLHEPMEAHDIHLTLKSDNNPIEVAPNRSDNKLLFSAFIHWIKKKIADKLIVINLSYGLLHHVEQGVLIVLPETFQQFIRENPQFEDHADEDPIELFVECQQLLKNKDDGLLHEYYLGEWNKRDVIQCLMVNADLLFAEQELPPINPNCHPELDLEKE